VSAEKPQQTSRQQNKTKLMKTLKLSLATVLFSSLIFYACNKEETTPAVQDQEIEMVRTDFTPANAANAEQIKQELEQVLRGNVDTEERSESKAAALVTECCLNRILEKVTHPLFGWINLHLEYDVSDPAQEVRIKHWVQTDAGWNYLGENTITTSYETCTEKSVNMSVGHLPESTILSWSRIWDGSSFCGGSQIEIWDNF